MNIEADSELTDLSDELFLFGLESNQILSESTPPDYLYHYTDSATIKLILQRDEIQLRFTRFDCFQDVGEGKHIIPVYRRVIKKMLVHALIDEEFYKAIYEIQPENRTFISEDPDSTDKHWKGHAICCDNQVYIFCCSLTGKSKYMFTEYIKGKDGKGASLEFSNLSIKDSINYYGKGFDFEIKSVLYESEQSYQKISTLIQKWYSMYDKNRNFLSIKSLISSLLSELQYYIKPSKYCNENEVRMVLFLPYELSLNSKRSEYNDVQVGEKHYVYVSMNKDSFSGLNPAPSMNPNDVAALAQVIKNNDYDF